MWTTLTKRVYRVLYGDDMLRVIESSRRWGVGHVCHDVTWTWEAGGIGHANYLPLDGRTEDSAQNLHGHPCQSHMFSYRSGHTLTAETFTQKTRNLHDPSVILTVRCGRVPFLLLWADEHGEGRVRHMEALVLKKNQQNLKNAALLQFLFI